jgi:predicted TPR repeat methyltransferase
MIALRTLLLLLSFAARLPAQDDAIWKRYFSWLQQGDPRTKNAAAYRAKLLSEGLTEAEAHQRLALVQKLRTGHREELVALQFSLAYTAPVDVFNKKPNAFIASMVQDLTPGAALDAAMGQGRNAVYLATRGWQVTGFDIAEEGLKVAQADAAKLGVKIATIKSRYQDFDWGVAKWDLIVFSYAWIPVADPALIARIRTSLKPGGAVAIELPSTDQSVPVAQREWPPEPTDEINALVKAWSAGFRIVRYEDVEAMCDWRNRKARIVRLLAKKWGE